MKIDSMTRAEPEISMQNLLFVIELSLTCLELNIRTQKEVVNPSVLAEFEYAIAHYIKCSFVSHIGINANTDKPIVISNNKKELIGYSYDALLYNSINHCRQIVDKMKRLQNIEEQISYMFSTAQDDFASDYTINHIDQVLDKNKDIVGDLFDKDFFEKLIKQTKIVATNEWSMKYLPKVDTLNKKKEQVNELISKYSFDDYLYHWMSVLNNVINTVYRKLNNSAGKSQAVGVLFLLTLFKEAGLKVKNESNLKELLETMFGIDQSTAKIYLHRLKNNNGTLYKSRDVYFDTAIKQIKSAFYEDTELRRNIIRCFESYKEDRQTIKEVLPPNRLTKKD